MVTFITRNKKGAWVGRSQGFRKEERLKRIHPDHQNSSPKTDDKMEKENCVPRLHKHTVEVKLLEQTAKSNNNFIYFSFYFIFNNINCFKYI